MNAPVRPVNTPGSVGKGSRTRPRKSYLTLSAVGEVGPAYSGVPADPRHPGLAEGLAPNLPPLMIGPTRLCGVCVTLIRETSPGQWSHVAIGFDHAPDPDAYRRIRLERDRPIAATNERDRAIDTKRELGWSESEERAAWGDR